MSGTYAYRLIDEPKGFRVILHLQSVMLDGEKRKVAKDRFGSGTASLHQNR